MPNGVEKRRSSTTPVSLGIAYPNPARALVNFDLSEIGEDHMPPTRIKIYDRLGHMVEMINIPSDVTSIQWSTAGVAEGVYLYDIQSSRESLHVGQVVIMK